MVKHKPTEFDAALPYPEPDGSATGGWSGSETSRERAKDEASSGTLQKRQQEVMNFLARRKWPGATWREVASTLGLHHGQASGALSNLHKDGRIVRLTEKRSKCAVYVYPEYVDGRQTAPYGRRKPVSEEAGSQSQSLAEAHQSGMREGYNKGEAEAMEQVTAFITRLIEASKTNVAQAHTHDCYKRHPVCALRAVRSYTSKVGARV